MEELLQNLSLEQKLNFISILICLANQDGDLDPRESQVLQEIAEKLGITEEQMNQLPIIIPVNKIHAFAESLQETPHCRFFVEQMVQLAKSDTRLLQEEEKLLYSVGKTLGFEEETLQKMIEA